MATEPQMVRLRSGFIRKCRRLGLLRLRPGRSSSNNSQQPKEPTHTACGSECSSPSGRLRKEPSWKLSHGSARGRCGAEYRVATRSQWRQTAAKRNLSAREGRRRSTRSKSSAGMFDQPAGGEVVALLCQAPMVQCTYTLRAARILNTYVCTSNLFSTGQIVT